MAPPKRLEGLSAQAATLFTDVDGRMLDASVVVSELRPLLAKIKDLFVEIDCVAVEQLSVKDSEERNLLSRLVEQERIHKVEFDRRVADWFELRGCKDGGESSSWREVPTIRSKMSKVSTCRRKSRSHSRSTSHNKTSSLVKMELGQLKLQQLQEQQAFELAAEQRQLLIQQEDEERERQRKREAEEREAKRQREERRRKLELADIHRQRELLKVTQELQQASLENQVWEEELERGGYIPMDDTEVRALVRTSVPTISRQENQQAEATPGPSYMSTSNNVDQSVPVERSRSLQPNPLERSRSPLHHTQV